MSIHVSGYKPSPSDLSSSATELELFVKNFPILQEYEQDILSCADYFFCAPSFAWCSWLLVDGAGPLYLGYLLLGWRQGFFSSQCSGCEAKAIVFRFGCGFPFSGGYSFSAFCPSCRSIERRLNEHGVLKLIEFVRGLRKRYPREVKEWEEFDGSVFSWGGNGLKPERRKRLKTTPMAQEVSFEQIFEELKAGKLRPQNFPNVSLFDLPASLIFDDAGGKKLKLSCQAKDQVE